MHAEMFQFAIALCIVSALGFVNSEAAKYPAGVNPHLCPNYPFCDNALLGAHASAAAGHAAPAYPLSVYAAPSPVAQSYPAGVNPHTCPNYPYCGPTPAHIPSYGGGWKAPLYNVWATPVSYAYGGPAAYAHGAPSHGAARYPAGVDPHSCPNYPYCH